MRTSQSPLRVALVSAFPPGRQTLNEYGLHLAQGLAQRTDVAEVVVIADKLPAFAEELDLGPKVRVRRTWSFNSLSGLPAILGALRAERVDGAIFNIQMASFGDRELPAALGLLAPACARITGIRSGVIAHNLVGGIDLEHTQFAGRRFRQLLIRIGGDVVTRALLSASYLTVTVESYRARLQDRFPGADVTLVPHGTFDTDSRPLTPSAERPMRLVTMGKFGTYKRLGTLLEAMCILRGKMGFRDLELVIGGTDHPGAPGYLATIAKACEGEPSIRFHGYVAEADIPEFFGSARASIFDYSATTGSSGVMHQAASYGAVPVFPAIGDFIDVCRDEKLSGLNYASGDANAMAHAIASLLDAPDMADRIARENREASLDVPFSQVVDFHVRRLTPGGAAKAGIPAEA